MIDMAPRSTALVTDWLTVDGGAPRVLQVLLASRPTAHIYALLYDAAAFQGTDLAQRPISTSFIQRFPGVTPLLPVMPAPDAVGSGTVRPARA